MMNINESRLLLALVNVTTFIFNMNGNDAKTIQVLAAPKAMHVLAISSFVLRLFIHG